MCGKHAPGSRGPRSLERENPTEPIARPSALRRAAPGLVLPVITALGVAAALLWPHVPVLGPVGTTQLTPPSYVRQFGVSGPGRLVEPVGIAADGDKVFVADAGSGEIVEFSSTGEFVRRFGKPRLRMPTYLALNPLDGRLYVSDRASRAILIFSVDGSHVGTFAPDPLDVRAARAVADWQPLGVAFGPGGTLYVSDVGARQRVVAFSPTGRFLAQTGDDVPLGVSGGRIAFVNGLAVTSGQVVAADGNNARLIVLGTDLTFRRLLPFDGVPRGLCLAPGGPAGAMAVVDAAGGEIRLVSITGRTLSSAGRPGGGRGELSRPTGVAADVPPLLYVADSGNRRVSVWDAGRESRGSVWLAVLRDPRSVAALLIGVLGALASGVVLVRRRVARRTL